MPAPPGAGAAMLPLFAHFEYAMREFTWREVTTQGLARTHAYFRDHDVQRHYQPQAVGSNAVTDHPGGDQI